jgi:hypothetical protein
VPPKLTGLFTLKETPSGQTKAAVIGNTRQMAELCWEFVHPDGLR